jgi:hypothetical protein
VGLSVVPQAQAVTGHKPLNDTRAVGARPVHVDFPIQYFGVVADLDAPSSHLPERGRAPFGEARFRVDGHWTAWQVLEQDGAQAAGHFTGALVSVDDADAYQVRGLPAAGHRWRAAAINATDGPEIVVGHRRAGAATAGPSCMSRADWGADESISGWSHGDTQDFSPAQVITVHHTAGPNDPSQDYAATVRATYSYHVQSNGWSDIGYQYLVGGNGIVYEGRNSGHTSTSCLDAGGDGSDFAHEPVTDEVVTGAHTGSYNTGNVGISVMGCFDPSASICTGDTTPTPAALQGVGRLVASLAARHDLQTNGMTDYVNPVNGRARTVHTVAGHRDWAATACPGQTLYDRLPSIRASSVRFNRKGRSVREDTGVVRLLVRRSGNTALPASVHYARTSGSAADGDYTVEPGDLHFAAGQAKKVIPVQINDDAQLERTETVRVTLSDPDGATLIDTPASMTVRIAPSDQQPDGKISRRQSSGYVGNDIYNRTAHKQRRTKWAPRRQARNFYVRVQNDGNSRNTLTLRASRPARASGVRYFFRGTDITRTLRSSTGWQVRLKRGGYRMVRMRIKVFRNAEVGSRKPARVVGIWSGDTTRKDVVAGVVKVVR